MQTLTRFLSVTALASAALFAAPAFAELKIVSVDVGNVIQQSPQYKAGAEKLKAEFERRKNDLEAERKRLADDAEKYKKERDLLSAADASKREKDLTTRNLDLQYKQRQFQEDLGTRDRQLTQEMSQKIKAAILAVSKEKGADLVVQDPIYASATVDITDEVLKRLQAPGAK
jgi:outer membrane protein